MSKILFAVSGSIASFKAAQTVSKLVQNGHEVQVAATRAALNFVGTATWEGLTDKPVLHDVFENGRQMDHIHVARWADVLILCPASASSIARWASGAASDFPSTLYLAFERSKPVLIAPAMNKEMWAHPAVQGNLEKLRDWGARVIEPEVGALACGETGDGRLASPEKIIEALETALAAESRTPARGKILVTAGGTREPIDGVRFITNFSTGRTGATLADQFQNAGFDVVYLHGQGAAEPRHASIKKITYTDYHSLEDALKKVLREQTFAAVVQAAAVSDFSVAEIEKSGSKAGGKLQSGQNLTVHLAPNPKLVLNIKEWSGKPSPRVIAFKLTDTDDKKQRKDAVDRLLGRKEIDAVVWNDISEVGPHAHTGRVFKKGGDPIDFTNKFELGTTLLDIIDGGTT